MIRYACLCLTFIFAFGCSSPISFSIVDVKEAWQQRQNNVLMSGELSIHSKQLLQTHFWEEVFETDPKIVLEKLYNEFCTTKKRDIVFTLCEISYYYANENPNFYTDALKYAYFYLFGSDIGDFPCAEDPRYRMACDFYNMSLVQYIKLKADSETIKWEFFKDNVNYYGFLLPKKTFSHFLLADAYQINNSFNQYRQYGLGVPLIAVRKEISEPKEIERYYILSEQGFPATVIAQISKSIYEFKSSKIDLDIYNTMHISHAKINQQQIVLEANYTIPMLYFLPKIKEEKKMNPFSGLFFAGTEQKNKNYNAFAF